MIEELQKVFEILDLSYDEHKDRQYQRYMEGILEWNEHVNLTAIKDREKGFLQAMKEADIDAQELILRTDFTKENSEKIAYQLIKDRFPYTALLCATDELLSGILKVFKKEKIQIPDQISVMSFENTLLTEIYEPKISVVSYDFIEIGKQMADLLIERAGKPYNKTKSLHRNATLLLRDSVKTVK